jgi:hypothetical protein
VVIIFSCLVIALISFLPDSHLLQANLNFTSFLRVFTTDICGRGVDNSSSGFLPRKRKIESPSSIVSIKLPKPLKQKHEHLSAVSASVLTIFLFFIIWPVVRSSSWKMIKIRPMGYEFLSVSDYCDIVILNENDY